MEKKWRPHPAGTASNSELCVGSWMLQGSLKCAMIITIIYPKEGQNWIQLNLCWRTQEMTLRLGAVTPPGPFCRHSWPSGTKQARGGWDPSRAQMHDPLVSVHLVLAFPAWTRATALAPRKMLYVYFKSSWKGCSVPAGFPQPILPSLWKQWLTV